MESDKESKSPDRNPWWKKLGWLIVIWSASVAALAVVAYVLRLFMNAAGLST